MSGSVAMYSVLQHFGRQGAAAPKSCRCGYAAIELMVTTVIISVLAATVGIFFVKLLNTQEREREEAYIREKLADVCGAYADMLSVGRLFRTSTNAVNQAISVEYRLETGGVSLETGIVSRVSHLTSFVDVMLGKLDLGIYGYESGVLQQKLSRNASGDAELIPLQGDMLSCTITPLNYSSQGTIVTNGYETTDAALGYLEIKAQYRVKNDEGGFEAKTVEAGRVVRLWNRE